MTASRNQRRREANQKLKIAADRLNEEKRKASLTAFQQKYTKCTDSLIAQYGSGSSDAVSLALLNFAEEITQKLLRVANIVAQKSGRNQVESNDVNVAALIFYKPKNQERDIQFQTIINNQRLPPISNSTAMHFGATNKVPT